MYSKFKDKIRFSDSHKIYFLHNFKKSKYLILNKLPFTLQFTFPFILLLWRNPLFLKQELTYIKLLQLECLKLQSLIIQVILRNQNFQSPGAFSFSWYLSFLDSAYHMN